MESAGAAGLRPTLPQWAVVSPERREHIERVAELAGALGRWRWECPTSERQPLAPRGVAARRAAGRAGGRAATAGRPRRPGPPELRHGPASAARAKAEGETDRGVLDAVRYHSIGLAEWDMVGRMLYCADYLEPGRKREREWRAELAARFPAEPALVLRAGGPRAGGPHGELRAPAPRTYGPFLEQPRRRALRIVLIVAAALALAAAVGCWCRRRRRAPRGPRLPHPSAEQRIMVEVLNGTRRAGARARRRPACCGSRAWTWCTSATRTRRRTRPGSSCGGVIPGGGETCAEALGAGTIVGASRTRCGGWT